MTKSPTPNNLFNEDEYLKNYNNSLKVNLPVGLNLDKLLDKHPITLRSKKRNRAVIKDKLAYFIGLVTRGLADEFNQGKREWVHLNSFYMQNVIRYYLDYIIYLANHEIIDIDSSYSNHPGNGYSRLYRLNPKFQTGLFKKYKITSSRLISIIEKKTINNSASRQYKRQYKDFDKLSIDMAHALEVLQSRYGNNYYKINQQLKLICHINYNLRRMFSLAENGRLFTQLTRLTKEVRKQLLKYDNKELFEIDVKCSIPTLSLTLFDNDILSRSSSIWSKLHICNPQVFPQYFHEITNMKISKKNTTDNDIEGIRRDSSVMYYKYCYNSFNIFGKFQILEDEYEDIKDYKDIVLNQDIYCYLANLWNSATSKKHYSRDLAKDKFNAILNSPSHHDCMERSTLVERFPNVMEIYSHVNYGYFKTKNGVGKNKRTKGDKKCPFAIFGQGIEAWFILDVVCDTLYKENPHIPIFTVHDSILTTHEYKNKVEEMILEKSEEILGYKLRVT